MDNPIKTAIKQICAEKGLSEDSVMETINSALAAAYRKDFGDKTQNIQAEYDLETGETNIFDVKEVVEDLTPEEIEEMEKIKKEREELKEKLASGEITAEELKEIKQEKQEQKEQEKEKNEEKDENEDEEEEKRKFNPRTMIQVSEAKNIDKSYKIGDEVRTELEIPGDFGRMAAQTAKQVIIQRLRESERNIIYQEFKEKEGEILTGMVQKFEGGNVIIDMNKASAILPRQEQIRGEKFKIGDRVKVYLLSVSLTTRGPEIIVSRAHPDIVINLFSLEIPEIANGVIEIKGIAREAGSRTKIAVHTEDESIDPIGSCIGQRGARIQTIISELHGEKIDIIEYDEDPIKYISNALLPAKITNVELDEKTKEATVVVPQDQLSLTIGRAGQNVRLASTLTGWEINIQEQETGEKITEEDLSEKKTENKEEQKEEKTKDKEEEEESKNEKQEKNNDKKEAEDSEDKKENKEEQENKKNNKNTENKK